MSAAAGHLGEYSLALQIAAAGAAPGQLRLECALLRMRSWCQAKGVTHVIAHPVGRDRYYVIRNPYDNSGSAICTTLIVDPSTDTGSHFSALLLCRMGMDHDGDNATFIAVLDWLSAQTQELHFGPEHRLFMFGRPCPLLFTLLRGAGPSL